MSLLLLGAFITLIANALLQRWRYGREAVDKRCDEIEKAATELASLSREYWLKPWPQPGPGMSITFRDTEYAMLTSQARINGLAQKVVGLNTVVAADFHDEDEPRLLDALAVFLDQVTGGEFEVRYRAVDFNRARGSEVASSDYVVVLRELATRRWEWAELARELKQTLRAFDRWLLTKASGRNSLLGNAATYLAVRILSARLGA